MNRSALAARIAQFEAAAISAGYLIVLIKGGISGEGIRRLKLSEVQADAVEVLQGELEKLGVMELLPLVPRSTPRRRAPTKTTTKRKTP